MAVTSGTITSASGNNTYFYLSWQQVSQSQANNSTTINWQAGIKATATAYWGLNAVKINSIYINGTKVSNGGTWSNQNLTSSNNYTIQLLNGTVTIPHNNDGTKTFSTSLAGWLYENGDFSASGNFELTPIILNPTFTTNPSVTNKTETSVTINRGTTNISSNFYWSLNNSTWTKFTSETATITGLSANTAYTVYIQARNANNESYKANKQVSVTTYSMPTQSLSSKTETRITMNWNIDSTANYIWYSTDNGSSWVAVGSVNATSGSYTITGLNANTVYNVRTKVRRATTQSTSYTTNLAVRTYNVPTQSLNSKTETSIKINWNIDSTADRLYYSTNNGSTWSSAITVSGTSGNYTITGLNANTTYTIKTRLRRSATQTTYDTTSLSVKTYALPTQSFADKAETTITMNWAIDSEADKLYYSTNNGSSWSNAVTVSGTSGTYTITGLTANTEYNVLLKLHRVATDSNVTVASATVVETYDYPHPLNAPNFTIGNAITLLFYNPLGRTCTLRLIGDNNNTILNTSINSTTFTGGNSAGSVTAQYASIPNKQSGQYRVQLIYSGVTKEYNNTGTYKIRGDEKPTFTTFEYEDVDTTTTSLTGDNQITVRDYSDVQITISVANKAVGNNSASIVKYRFTVGNTSVEQSYSSDSPVTATINNMSSHTIRVTAIDSRGLETTAKIETTMKNYINITFSKAKGYREDGVGTTVLFDIVGAYWNGNFGNTSNTINTIWYRWKVKNGTYSNWISIINSFTISNNNFTSNNNVFFPETNDGITPQTFDIGKEYDIEIAVTDALAGSSRQKISFSIDSGIPCTDKVKNSSGTYNIGINQLADSDTALSISGGLKVDDVKIIGGVAYFTNTANQEFETTATWQATNVEFNTIDSTTPLITLNSNGAKIGKGISKVLVSGTFTTNGYLAAGALQIGIAVNGTLTGKYIRRTIQTSWTHIDLVMPPQPIDVRENDVINLVCTPSAIQSSVKFSKNFVFMTVQAIS